MFCRRSSWFLVLACAVPAVFGLTVPRGFAQEAKATADAGVPAPAAAPKAVAEKPSVSPEDAAHAAQLREQAEQVRALLAGELSPAVQTDALLTFDLSGSQVEDLGPVAGVLRAQLAGDEEPSVLNARMASAASEAAQASESDNPLTAARGALQDALLGYLRLSEKKRDQLVGAHSKAHQTYQQLAEKRDALTAQRKALAERFRQAEAYLDGTLDAHVAPAGLFVLSLKSEPQDKPLTGWAAKREASRRAKLPTWQRDLVAASETLTVQIGELHRGLEEAAARYAALTPEQRAGLEQARRKKLNDAASQQQQQLDNKRRANDIVQEAELARTSAEREQAAAQAEREAALRAAEEARTEAQRLLAAEKARVLGRKAQLSEIRGKIAADEAALTERYDQALGLVRQTRELHERSVLDPNKMADADRLYSSLRRALSDYHELFSEALGWLLQPESRLPQALTPSDQKFLTELDEPELNRMWGELRTLREKVEAEEDQLGNDRAAKLRDAVVLLNDARLSLLTETSSGLRSSVRGFGPEGVEQAVSEARHMLLLARYHLISLPTVVGQLKARASGATLMIFFSVVQVLLLIAAYRFYRKRAEPLLTQMYRDTLANSDGQGLNRAFARLLWYLRRLYEPLGAWAFYSLLFSYVRGIDLLPEIDFLWIIVQWFLVGWTAVLAVDAFAERQNKLMRQRSDDPKLRIRSLRLLAFFFLGTGMLLSLTERSVGEGTIFAWTRFVAWLGMVPVLAILAHWWEPLMKARMDAREELPAVLGWARRHMDGPLGMAGELLAAAYLLGEGVVRWGARWLSEFELTQKITAYFFRKKVQERSQNGAAASVGPTPQYDSFVPGEQVGDALLPDMHQKAMSKLLSAARTPGTVSLLVGDRGMGKSSLLTRLGEQLPGNPLRLSCPHTLAELRVTLREAVEAVAEDDASLAAALRAKGIGTLLLDDIHRLVRPEVFGLQEFDGTLSLLRSLRAAVSTVMTSATPGYVLLSRGRGALGLDVVATLEPLTRKQITTLIKARCDAAKITPSYDELVVPRAFDMESANNEDPIETGYFRLLWDYSGGNPAVALYYFQRSLFRDERGRLVVRVFEEPDRVALDTLPRSMPFVFRTLMQLSEGDIPTVARCLNISESETRDVIEMGMRRGYLESVGESVRVSLPWLREIKVLLRRQHLLS